MTACAAVPEPDQTDAYAQAQEQFDSIKSRLRSSSAKAWTVSDLENFLETESRELLRRFAQGYLDEQGPGEVAEPVTDSNRQKCTHQRLHSRTITTIFGNVTLRRQGYGGRGFKSLHPLDAKLNLPPEIYTHSLRRRMSEEAAKESFDETQGDIRRQTGVSVPKRQIEQSVCRAAQDFDQFYEQQRAQALPDSIKSGLILALTVDLKGVSMRKIDLREATRKTAEGRAHKMRHRRSPGEKSGTKRMATVAAVYNIEPFERTPEQIVRELGPVRDPLPRRPRPEDKRVWASIKQSPKTIIEQAFDEATRRDPNHVKQWVALVDGSELQLDLLLEAAKKRGIKLVIILDLIHVLEYLWTVVSHMEVLKSLGLSDCGNLEPPETQKLGHFTPFGVGY